jgi:hypothetical protein
MAAQSGLARNVLCGVIFIPAAFPIDVEHNWLAIIGGLTWKLSREEYRWLEAAFIKARLRCAMDRVVLGPDGKPLKTKTASRSCIE